MKNNFNRVLQKTSLIVATILPVLSSIALAQDLHCPSGFQPTKQCRTAAKTGQRPNEMTYCLNAFGEAGVAVFGFAMQAPIQVPMFKKAEEGKSGEFPFTVVPRSSSAPYYLLVRDDSSVDVYENQGPGSALAVTLDCDFYHK